MTTLPFDVHVTGSEKLRSLADEINGVTIAAQRAAQLRITGARIIMGDVADPILAATSGLKDLASVSKKSFKGGIVPPDIVAATRQNAAQITQSLAEIGVPESVVQEMQALGAQLGRPLDQAAADVEARAQNIKAAVASVGQAMAMPGIPKRMVGSLAEVNAELNRLAHTGQLTMASIRPLINTLNQFWASTSPQGRVELRPVIGQFMQLSQVLQTEASSGAMAQDAFRKVVSSIQAMGAEAVQGQQKLMDIGQALERLQRPGAMVRPQTVQNIMLAAERALQDPAITERGKEALRAQIPLLNETNQLLQAEALRLKEVSREQMGMSTHAGTTAKMLLYAQSATQGVMTAMALLSGNVLFAGFGLIFMRFTVVRVMLAFMALTAVMGGLMKILTSFISAVKGAGAAMQKWRFQIMEQVGDIKQLVGLLRLVDESTRKYGFGMDATTKAAMKLRNEGLGPLIDEFSLVRDFARVTGMEIDAAADVIVQAIGRETGALESLGDVMGVIPEIFNENLEALNEMSRGQRAEFVINLLKRYQGAADRYAQTLPGALDRVRESFQGFLRDLTEPFARDVLAPALNRLANFINMIAKAVRAVKEFEPAARLWRQFLDNMAIGMRILLGDTKAMNEKGFNATVAILMILLRVLVLLSSAFIKLAAFIRWVAHALRDFLRFIKPAIDFLRSLWQVLKGILSPSILQTIKEFFANLPQYLLDAVTALIRATDMLLLPILRRLAREIITNSSDIASALKNIPRAVDTLARELGGEVLRALGRAVDNVLGVLRRLVLGTDTLADDMARQGDSFIVPIKKVGRELDEAAGPLGRSADSFLRRLRRLVSGVDTLGDDAARQSDEFVGALAGISRGLDEAAETIGRSVDSLTRVLEPVGKGFDDALPKVVEASDGFFRGIGRAVLRGVGNLLRPGGTLRRAAAELISYMWPPALLRALFRALGVTFRTSLGALFQVLTLPIRFPLSLASKLIEGLANAVRGVPRQGATLVSEALSKGVADGLMGAAVGMPETVAKKGPILADVLARSIVTAIFDPKVLLRALRASKLGLGVLLFIPDFIGSLLIDIIVKSPVWRGIAQVLWGAVMGAIGGAAVAAAAASWTGPGAIVAAIVGAIGGALIGAMLSLLVELGVNPAFRDAVFDFVNKIPEYMIEALSGMLGLVKTWWREVAVGILAIVAAPVTVLPTALATDAFGIRTALWNFFKKLLPQELVGMVEGIPGVLAGLWSKVKLPDISLPDIKLPSIGLPDIKLPDVKLPALGLGIDTSGIADSLSGLMESFKGLGASAGGFVGAFGPLFEGFKAFATGPGMAVAGFFYDIQLAVLKLDLKILRGFVEGITALVKFDLSVLRTLANIMLDIAGAILKLDLVILRTFAGVLLEVADAIVKLDLFILRTLVDILLGVAGALLKLDLAILRGFISLLGELGAIAISAAGVITTVLSPAVGVLVGLFRTNLRVAVALVTTAIEVFVSTLQQAVKPAVDIVVGALQALIADVQLAFEVFDHFIRMVGYLLGGEWAKAWDEFKEVMQAPLRWAERRFRAFVRMVSGIFRLIKVLVVGQWKLTTRAIGRTASILVDELVGYFKKLWKLLVGSGGVILSMMDEIVSYFVKLPGRILDALGDLVGLLTQKGEELLEGFWDGIKDVWDSDVVRWIKDLDNKVVRAVGTVTRTLKQKGKDLLDGLLDGMKWFWTMKVKGWLLIAEKVKKAVGVVTKVLEQKGKDLLDGLWTGLKWFWNHGGIKTWLNVAEKVKSAVGNPIGWLQEKGKQVVHGLWKGMYWFWHHGGIKGWLNFAEKVHTAFGTASTILKNKGKAVIGGLWTGMVEFWRDSGMKWWLNTALPWLIETQLSVVKNVGEWLLEAGKSIFRGLYNGMKDIWDNVIKPWIESLGGVLPDWLKTAFEALSPSRVMQRVGLSIMEGLTLGLKDTRGVQRAMKDAADLISGTSLEPQLGAMSIGGGFTPAAAAGGAGYNSTAPIYITIEGHLVGQDGMSELAEVITDAQMRRVRTGMRRAVLRG